jgi:hypothetical protein
MSADDLSDVGGEETYGHYLYLEDAEQVSKYLRSEGHEAGVVQHGLIRKINGPHYMPVA